MKICISFLLAFFFLSQLYAVLEETASLEDFLYGDAPACEYDNWLSHVAEGVADPGYNLYAPYDRQTNGFGGFAIPDSTDLNIWANIIDEFLLGNLDAAQNLIDNADIPYQVVIFHDIDSQQTFYMLREIPDMNYFDDNGTDDPGDDEYGAFNFGWGLYIYFPAGNYPHITTAPHPNDDYFTVPIAHKVFIEHGSKFLLISGVGREVIWTNSGYYNNGKSLCDPSRVEAHPFNVSYQKFCDLIRFEFGRHEFSIQIHSYDWGDRHWGYPDVQISGGYYISSPDLPIRDLSSAHLDIVSASGEIIHPANSVGMNSEVHLNDFYGFHCSEYEFNFSNADTTFPVNTNIDLWGYSSNRQILYTQAGMNHYDNFERFLHLEMDELPNQYPQTVQNLHWFHGWDPVSLQWNMNQRFENVFEYYSPWIDALQEVLPDMYQMNDNQIPIAPTELEVISENADHIRIGWQAGDCYDMETYEILYSTEPIGNGNYDIIDKNDFQPLSCLAQNSYQLNGLVAGESYYFAVRIKDKQENLSDLSNEVMGIAGPAQLSDLYCVGKDEEVQLNWLSTSNNIFSGFNIYRKLAGEDFSLLSSWQTNPDLTGIEGQDISYSYLDENVENGEIYTYKLASENADQEYFFGNEVSANPQKIYEIYAAQIDGTLADTCYFGFNKFASNGYDQLYDLPANDTLNTDFLYCQFYEEYWNNVPNELFQEIDYIFDPETQLRSWVFRLRTDQLGQTIEIGLNHNSRDAERVYLYNNGNFTDLQNETFLLNPTNSDYYYFTLYLGNLTPTVEFDAFNNRLFYPNETATFEWSVNLNSTIDHINCYAENDEMTIPIGLELNPFSNQIDWDIPNLLFQNLQFKIDLIMMEGDTLTYLSPYKFGIVSPQTNVQIAAGWQMCTHYLDSPQIPTEDIYGLDSEFFLFQNENFIQINEPDFLQPFWIYAPQENYCALNNANILQNAFSFELEQGWNLIPNPHKANYQIQQLIFSVNNIDLDYYQAVQNRLIESQIFYYDENFYPQTSLNQGKSSYLFSYEEDVVIKYIPYHTPLYFPEFETEWEAEVIARDGNGRSAVQVGISASADSLYDENFDLIKPLAKPFDSNLNFSLPMQIPTSITPVAMHRSITSPKDESQSFVYCWEAELELSEPETIEFSFSEIDLPPDYHVYLKIADEYSELQPQDWISYEAFSDLLQFQILITDQTFSGSSQSLVPLAIHLMNYPNPFNPSTTISFNLTTESTENTEIVIYNLKGQRIRTLECIDCVDAASSQTLHSITWNGRDDNNKLVSSGVYFYQLKVDKKPVASRKMLLVK